jgi:hypothetical protein
MSHRLVEAPRGRHIGKRLDKPAANEAVHLMAWAARWGAMFVGVTRDGSSRTVRRLCKLSQEFREVLGNRIGDF